MVNSLSELQALVQSGETNWKQYGDVRAVYKDQLVLFNYTAQAQYLGRWNWFELNSRGLILNRNTGEIVALPFPKFFNWGELGKTTNAFIHAITEKIDGSLAILYREDGHYKLTTRGVFDAEQAIWATDFLNRRYSLDGLSDEMTLLFEIIYPENRIVVNYGDREDLVLIGARNRFTGEMLRLADLKSLAKQFGFNMPRTYDFSSVDDLIVATHELPVENEGWVVTFEDGSLFKFKGKLYQLAHKLLTGVTFNQVLQAVANGQFEALIEGIPDEFLVTVRAYQQQIQDKVAEITNFIKREMQFAPQDSRRDFALWVQERVKTNPLIHSAYFFAALDGKPLTPIIYRYAFE